MSLQTRRYGHPATNNSVEDETASFPGAQAKYTHFLELVPPESREPFPVYRVMDRDGQVLNASEEPQVKFWPIIKFLFCYFLLLISLCNCLFLISWNKALLKRCIKT